jgi:hypothetical protein
MNLVNLDEKFEKEEARKFESALYGEKIYSLKEEKQLVQFMIHLKDMQKNLL